MKSHEMPEKPQEDPKILAAIKELLIGQLAAQDKASNFVPWEFDISDPHLADMQRIKTGDFEITDLNITPGVKGSRVYNFRVGNTEFHLAGRAAEQIENKLRQAA